MRGLALWLLYTLGTGALQLMGLYRVGLPGWNLLLLGFWLLTVAIIGALNMLQLAFGGAR